MRNRAACYDGAGAARQRALLNRLTTLCGEQERAAVKQALAAAGRRDGIYAASYRPAAADAAVDEALRRAVASTAAHQREGEGRGVLPKRGRSRAGEFHRNRRPAQQGTGSPSINTAVAAQLSRRLALPAPPPARAMSAWEDALEAWFAGAGTQGRLAVFNQLFACSPPEVLRALASALRVFVPEDVAGDDLVSNVAQATHRSAEVKTTSTTTSDGALPPVDTLQDFSERDLAVAPPSPSPSSTPSPSLSPPTPSLHRSQPAAASRGGPSLVHPHDADAEPHTPSHHLPPPPSPGPHSSSSGSRQSPSTLTATAEGNPGGSHSAPVLRTALGPNSPPASNGAPPSPSGVALNKVDMVARLPMPLGKYILSFLSAADLRAAAVVSRTWHRAVTQLKEDRLHRQEALDLVLGLRQQGRDPTFEMSVDMPHPYAKAGFVRRLERNIFCSAYTSLVCRDPNREDAPRAAAVGPNGRFASAGVDKILRFWDARTARLQQEVAGHAGSVRCLALCPKLDLVLTGSYDTSVRLWDENSGHCIRILRGHSATVLSGSICQVSLLALTADKSGRACLWDLRHDEGIPASEVLLDSAVQCMAAGGAGGGAPAPRLFVAGCQNGQVLLLGADFPAVQRRDKSSKRDGGIAAQSTPRPRSPQTRAAGQAGGKQRQRGRRRAPSDVETGRLAVLLRRKAHKGAVHAVDLDAYFLATGGADGVACLWPYTAPTRSVESDVVTRMSEQPLTTFNHVAEVTAVRVHGVRVITGASDGRLRIWQALTGECLRVIRVGSPNATVWSLHFFSDNDPGASDVDSYATPSPDTLVANTAGSLQVLNFPLSHKGQPQTDGGTFCVAPSEAISEVPASPSSGMSTTETKLPKPLTSRRSGRRSRGSGSFSLPTPSGSDAASLLDSGPPSPQHLTEAPYRSDTVVGLKGGPLLASPVARRAADSTELHVSASAEKSRRDSLRRQSRPRLASLGSGNYAEDDPPPSERRRPHMPLVPSSRASFESTASTMRRPSTSASNRSSIGSIAANPRPSLGGSGVPRPSLSLASHTGITAMFNRRQSTPDIVTERHRNSSTLPSNERRRSSSLLLSVPTLSGSASPASGLAEEHHPNFGRRFSGEWRTHESLARRRAVADASTSDRRSNSSLSTSWSGYPS
jgi:WD40 repeat protein